jgi:hypothetical protein
MRILEGVVIGLIVVGIPALVVFSVRGCDSSGRPHQPSTSREIQTTTPPITTAASPPPRPEKSTPREQRAVIDTYSSREFFDGALVVSVGDVDPTGPEYVATRLIFRADGQRPCGFSRVTNGEAFQVRARRQLFTIQVRGIGLFSLRVAVKLKATSDRASCTRL